MTLDSLYMQKPARVPGHVVVFMDPWPPEIARTPAQLEVLRAMRRRQQGAPKAANRVRR